MWVLRTALVLAAIVAFIVAIAIGSNARDRVSWTQRMTYAVAALAILVGTVSLAYMTATL